jgi:hypothetical protein
MPKVSPPKTDKGELGDESLLSPEMGGGEDLGDEEEITEPGPETEKPGLKALMQKKGFKSEEDFIKSFENLERKITELSQENRMLASRQFQPSPAVSDTRKGKKLGEDIEDPYDLVTDKVKFKKFTGDVEEIIEDRVQRGIEKKEFARMAEEALALRDTNPKEFEKLRPFMLQVTQQYPNMTKLQDVYNKAKEMRTEYIEDLRSEMLGDVDLKAIGGKLNPAQITSSGGGSPEIKPLTDRQAAEKKIRDSILKATKIEA